MIRVLCASRTHIESPNQGSRVNITECDKARRGRPGDQLASIKTVRRQDCINVDSISVSEDCLYGSVASSGDEEVVDADFFREESSNCRRPEQGRQQAKDLDLHCLQNVYFSLFSSLFTLRLLRIPCSYVPAVEPLLSSGFVYGG